LVKLRIGYISTWETKGRHEQEKGVTREELERLVKEAEAHEKEVRAKWK
jgi:hypothetical protein